MEALLLQIQGLQTPQNQLPSYPHVNSPNHLIRPDLVQKMVKAEAQWVVNDELRKQEQMQMQMQ